MAGDSLTDQPKYEQAFLAFLKWVPAYETSKPYQVFTSLPLGVPTTNLVFEDDEETTIDDLKCQPNQFTLDDHGFQLCKDQSTFTSFDDVEKIEEFYLPEVEALIQQHVEGSVRIVFFDWRVCECFSSV